MNNKQFLKDLLAYVNFVHNDRTVDDETKYHRLVQTLGHDLNGLINEDECFLPRVSGYAWKS